MFKLLLFLFIGSEEFWRRTMYDKSKRLTASHCNGSNSQQHNIKHKAPLQTAKGPAHFSFLCVKSSCTLLWIRGGNVEMWRHWEGFLITPASLILYMINNTQRFCHQAEQPGRLGNSDSHWCRCVTERLSVDDCKWIQLKGHWLVLHFKISSVYENNKMSLYADRSFLKTRTISC